MLVYLDTNIWIYAYENDPVFGASARRALQELHHPKHRIASSLFVLNELLVVPTRSNDYFTLASYRRLFRSSNLLLLPYTLTATEIYAQLRARDRLKALDALHLATAAMGKVDLFLTQDTKLLSLTVPGIGAIADLGITLS